MPMAARRQTLRMGRAEAHAKLAKSSEAFSSNSGSAPSKKDYIVKRNNDRNGVH